MAETVDYYIAPELGQAGVLAGDLTPLPANACEAFIHAYAPAGGLVWDPFCRGDTVARVAARQGKRALLSDFNPLIAFTVGATLSPVSPRQLDRAFAQLSAAPILQTTLAEHINSLYATSCPMCGRPATARSFSWSGEPPRLSGKELHCQTCNTLRQSAVGEEDLQALSKVEEHGRAYWTLLERLGATEGSLRPLGERLLSLYTARSLYALWTIQSKLELLTVERPVQDVLALGLLDTLERCAKAAVDERGQRQRLGLLRPAARGGRAETLQEQNCWSVFSAACSEQRARLERNESAMSYLRSALPSSGSRSSSALHAADAGPVLVRQASPRHVAAGMSEGAVDLVLAAPPVLDWGDMLHLSYLWTGWLLGKDEARRFSPDYLLHPKRSTDWAWLSAALTTSLRAISSVLNPDGKVVFAFSLASLTYLNVLAVAAAAAGLQLENIAYQPGNADSLRRPLALGGLAGFCYLRFGRAEATPARPAADVSAADVMESAQHTAIAAASELLRQRGEPAAYVWLNLAMLLRLSQAGSLARLAALPADDMAPWDRLRQIETVGLQAHSESVQFLPLAAAEPTPDAETGDVDGGPDLARRRGWWWLSDTRAAESPLSDRVEWAIYTVLSTSPLSGTEAITRVVHALFPGLQTPDPGLIEACLESYASAAAPLHWQLRPAEGLAQRSHEHTQMVELLVHLGRRLGFRVWISRAELHNRQHGQRLLGLLSVAERYINVEDILPDASEHSQLVDVIWYQERRASHVFEVEWTAMLGESVLRRGSSGKDVKRYLVVPPERLGLIQMKIERMPNLSRRLAGDDWRFVRFDVLRELASAETVALSDLDSRAGFTKQEAPQGRQLALW